MRDSTTLLRTQCDALRGLDAEQFKAAVLAIWDYELDDKDTSTDPVTAMALGMVKPLIDKRRKKSEAGRAGGEAKAKQTVANAKQTPSIQEADTKQTVANAKQTVAKEERRKKKEEINSNSPLPPSGEWDALIDEQGFGESLTQTVKDWCRYKTERRDRYKPQGFNALLTTIRNNVAIYGEAAVRDCIALSMGNNWKGIIWDRIDKTKHPPGKSRNDIVDTWT